MSHGDRFPDSKEETVSKTDYDLLTAQIKDFLNTEPHYVSALSNISALIAECVSDLNWAGFYLVRSGKLTVGPFQGKPACIHIAFGKGVCGTAAERDETVLVPDVHEFPGHIACDSASNSELVVPVHHEGKIIAVLDLDSPLYGRFSGDDREGFEQAVKAIEEGISWGEPGK